MIHAFLITAYRDADALEQLVARLMSIRDSRIYLHIDRRRNELVCRMRRQAAETGDARLQVRSDFRVHWGSFQHLEALMVLAQQAFSEGCEFFHTMTGQCRIVCSAAEFEAFFLAKRHSNFLEHFPLPTADWRNGGLDRLRHFQLFDLLGTKRRGFYRINGAFVRLQRMLGVDRLNPADRYFGGSTYYSINRPAMNYLLREYPKHASQYRHTFCSEEIAPHTILCNGPAELRDSIVNDNLRYVLWRRKHGEKPGLLDLDDRAAIAASECIFARKFDSVISAALARSFDDSPTPS